MMKSLDTIQKISKVFKTLCSILSVLYIVWAAGSLLAVIFSAPGQEIIKIGGVSVHSLIIKQTGYDINGVMGLYLHGIFTGAAYSAVYGFASKYFAQELKDGTPFTKSGAKMLRTLGIYTIVLPLAAVIVTSIVCAYGKYTVNAEDNEASVVMGLVILLVSLLLEYGAELEEHYGK